MAAEGEAGGMTGYIKHHLQHLTVSVGEGPFMALNLDSIFFKVLLAVIFLFVFLRASRRATAGVPGKLQCAIEMLIEGIDGIVRETFPAKTRFIAPLALTIFALGAPIGAWLGADVAGSIADAQGWRGAFLWLGIPGILFGALFYLTVKEPRRGRFDAVQTDAGDAPTFRETMAYIWKQPAAVHVIMASGVSALWGRLQ